MRAVAVLMGCITDFPVASFPVKWVSAYSLLKDYETQVEIYPKDQESYEIREWPKLDSGEAKSVAKGRRFRRILVMPNENNFLNALEILRKRVVNCAGIRKDVP
jgi:hypothetical protein